MATPVYDNGTWGSVLGVYHNGTVYERPVPGLVEYRLPRGSVEVSIPCPDRPDHPPLVITLDRSVWPAIMVQSDDARVAPAWASLVQAAVITLELLADVPEPEEEVFARNKAAKFNQLADWFTSLESAGWTIPNTSQQLSFRLDDGNTFGSALSLTKEAVALGLIAEEAATVTWICVDGSAVSFPLAQARAVLVGYGLARSQLSISYATYKASIEAATTAEQLDAITFE